MDVWIETSHTVVSWHFVKWQSSLSWERLWHPLSHSMHQYIYIICCTYWVSYHILSLHSKNEYPFYRHFRNWDENPALVVSKMRVRMSSFKILKLCIIFISSNKLLINSNYFSLIWKFWNRLQFTINYNHLNADLNAWIIPENSFFKIIK